MRQFGEARKRRVEEEGGRGCLALKLVAGSRSRGTAQGEGGDGMKQNLSLPKGVQGKEGGEYLGGREGAKKGQIPVDMCLHVSGRLGGRMRRRRHRFGVQCVAPAQ